MAKLVVFYSRADENYFSGSRRYISIGNTGKVANMIAEIDKTSLFLMGKQWAKMLDILINEKPVYCSKELLVAMKVEAKYEASNAKQEREKKVFASIVRKLTCFLEAIGNHNLSHLLKENAVKMTLPDFLSADEKAKLTQIYRFPMKEQTMVADRSARYQEAIAR